MGLVTWKNDASLGGIQMRRTVVGNKRLVIGRATLGAGTNHIQTGLRVIISSNVVPLDDVAATGHTVLTKHSTAEGTENDAPESGFLTIEGAEALDYQIWAWGW